MDRLLDDLEKIDYGENEGRKLILNICLLLIWYNGPIVQIGHAAIFSCKGFRFCFLPHKQRKVIKINPWHSIVNFSLLFTSRPWVWIYIPRGVSEVENHSFCTWGAGSFIALSILLFIGISNLFFVCRRPFHAVDILDVYIKGSV
jgi:hypothetical protein